MEKSIKQLLREGLLSEKLNSSFIAYHGSPTKINSFVDDFVGGKDAIDQNGPGIYLTTKLDEAYGYAEEGYVYHLEVNNGNFLDSKERSESYLRKYTKDITNLIKMSPDWEMDAQNWDIDPQVGLRTMVNNFIEYNTNERDIFLQVWIDVYRGIEVQFVRNMVKLGYDGVFVKDGFQSGTGGDHIIIYNTKLISINKIEEVEKESLKENEYPIANPPQYSDTDYKARNGKIINMSPKEYLNLVPKLELDEESIENIEELVDMMSQGREIDPPTLYLDGEQVINHDGRHRVYASIELGYDTVPVLLIDVNNKEISNTEFKPQVK